MYTNVLANQRRVMRTLSRNRFLSVYPVTPEVYRNNLTAGSIAGLVGGLLFGLILLLLSIVLCRPRRAEEAKKEGGQMATSFT